MFECRQRPHRLNLLYHCPPARASSTAIAKVKADAGHGEQQPDLEKASPAYPGAACSS